MESSTAIEKRQYETVKLRTGIDPNFLADTLTTDIELTDALFDLIDNSIDSARDEIIKGQYDKDSRGLPNDYSEYGIKLRFTNNSIIIEDNSTGFATRTLEENAFYTGLRSNHKYGIGYYGLGLKRALLKAGSSYGIITDNGENLYKSSFKPQEFSSDGDTDLTAKKYGSTKRPRTILIVSSLHSDTLAQIQNTDWIKNMINGLAVRYAMFLKKGLRIKVICSQPDLSNTYYVTPKVPSLRQELIKPIRKEAIISGVKSEFEVGIHSEYTFPGEWDYDLEKNKKLTTKYGVYYIFNDRVIVESSLESKHGFTTNWHSEYGGFVCLVHVTGENPKDLPWNTAKTDVKLYSPLFLDIISFVEPLAKTYRSQAKKLINIWVDKETKHLPEKERKKIFAEKAGAKQLSDSEISALSRKVESKKPQKVERKKGAKDLTSEKKPTLKTTVGSRTVVAKNRDKHTKNWTTLLPSHFPVSETSSILDNLIVEAESVKIDDAPHATCMLYRALLEAAFRAFVKKNGLFENVKEHYYSKGEGARKGHSEAYKKQQGIDLSICSSWMLDSTSLFPQESRKKLALCARNVKKHIQFMNGVVHGNQIIGSDNKVQSIRNETVELLEFLTIGKTNID